MQNPKKKYTHDHHTLRIEQVMSEIIVQPEDRVIRIPIIEHNRDGSVTTL
jgi:hypothetical protein